MLPFDAQAPELFHAAYDLGWYEGFDTFVLVGTQLERYRRDPERHAAHLAFVRRGDDCRGVEPAPHDQL